MPSMTLGQANSKPQPKVNHSQLFGMEEGEAGSESRQNYAEKNSDNFFVKLQRILKEDSVDNKVKDKQDQFPANGEIVFKGQEIQVETSQPDSATNESLNEILNTTSEYTIKVAENVATFTGGMVVESAGAFADLFKIVAGKDGSSTNEKPGDDKKGSEKLKKEQFAWHVQAWNSELQAAQLKEIQITEAKEEARSEVVGNTEQVAQAAGFQSGYEKVKNIYSRSFISLKRAWDSLKAKKNEKPLHISSKRSGQKGEDIRTDKAAEGGRLSNTGGAGVG